LESGSDHAGKLRDERGDQHAKLGGCAHYLAGGAVAVFEDGLSLDGDFPTRPGMDLIICELRVGCDTLIEELQDGRPVLSLHAVAGIAVANVVEGVVTPLICLSGDAKRTRLAQPPPNPVITTSDVHGTEVGVEGRRR